MRDYTVVYSSASKQALEELINETLLLFNSTLSIKDMFYYGIFCKPETYAYYDLWEHAPSDLEIPFNLINECAKPKEKIDYVNGIINQILQGTIEKPEWMFYVEMEDYKTELCLPPSTFLYIYPKEEKYKKLAEKLIQFLYSPNLLITMLN